MTALSQETSRRSAFWTAFRGLPDNPIARREWRGLAHQARDWRLWLGLRLPKDARGWGLPALGWCALLPYLLWVFLRITLPVVFQQIGYLSRGARPDAMTLGVVLVGIYVCLMAVALMAPAVTRERERQTWEALRTTAASSHEILLGLAAGRLAPVLFGYLALGLVWVILRPHYSELLAPLTPFRLDQPELALLVWELALVATAIGAIAAAISAWSRTSGQAVVLATGAAVFFLMLVGAAAMLAPSIPGPVLTLVFAAVATVAGYIAAVRGLAREAAGRRGRN